MRRLFIGFSLSLLPALGLAQDIAEPLSFTGVPQPNDRAMVDLSARLGFFDEVIAGADVDNNFNAFLFEGRFQVNQQVGMYALLPIGDFSSTTQIGGLVIEADDTDIGNPEIGALFSLPSSGMTAVAFGMGLGLPVADNADAGIVGGLVSNDINVVLYSPDIFSLRPHVRFGLRSGVVSLQSLLGVDIGVGVDGNDDDIVALRGALNAGVSLAPTFALMGEVTFNTDFDDNNDFAFATLHLGGRGQVQGAGGSFQPAFEFFLPISDDLQDLVEFGLAFSLRAVF